MPMIIGAVIFATGCGGGLVAGWFAGVANQITGSISGAFGPFDADLQVDAPNTATVREPFEIEVTITDTSGSSRTISTIDFNGDIADAVSITAVSPAQSGLSSSPGWAEYNFYEPLDAYATQTFVFTVSANQPGTFTGSIDVYMEDFQSDSRPITISVSAESED
ncbi:MAG: hypothetical protein RIB60_07015 [Phycisphaerales bacterium]